MAKRRHLKHSGLLEKTSGNDLRDRISLLPDDIVVHILSYLPMRQAVATSTLSKRWRSLWTKIPGLIFDADNMCGRELSYVERRLKTLEFVRWVDRILRQFSGLSLNISAFSVYYELTEAVVSHIDSWVLFALNHNVQRINLHLRRESPINSWLFPPLAACEKRLHDLRDLSIGGCQIVPSFDRFKSLRSVYLAIVVLTDEAFEDLMSNCLLLSELFVCSADDLINVRIPASLVRLRSLQIYSCINLQKMEVNAANLVSLSYVGPVISFSFNNISKLRFLHLPWIDNACSRLMSKNLQLNLLVFDFDLSYGESDDRYKLFPVLNNLKELILSVACLKSGFVGFAKMLRAIPSLRKFGLHLKGNEFSTPELDDMIAEKFHHKNLREIELSGFSGRKEQINLALFLIESAVVLEKISILPYRKRWFIKRWHCDKPDPEHVDAVRKCADQISSKLPPTAKLEILESW